MDYYALLASRGFAFGSRIYMDSGVVADPTETLGQAGVISNATLKLPVPDRLGALLVGGGMYIVSDAASTNQIEVNSASIDVYATGATPPLDSLGATAANAAGSISALTDVGLRVPVLPRLFYATDSIASGHQPFIIQPSYQAHFIATANTSSRIIVMVELWNPRH